MSRPSVVFENGRYNGRTLREWLPDLVDHIVAGFDPVKIIVFGSLARQEEDRGSDIDVLVILPQVDDKLEAMAALRRATNDIPVPKDFVVSDPAEIEELGDVVGYVYRPALREGTVVYERTQ